MVTLWSPHHSTTCSLGDDVTLRDVRVSDFQGGCLDTTEGTSLEVYIAYIGYNSGSYVPTYKLLMEVA